MTKKHENLTIMQIKIVNYDSENNQCLIKQLFLPQAEITDVL